MIARTAWLLMAFVKIMTKKKQQLNNIGFFLGGSPIAHTSWAKYKIIDKFTTSG